MKAWRAPARAPADGFLGKLRTGDDGLDDEADFQYIIAVAWLANEWMNPLFSFFFTLPVKLVFVTKDDIFMQQGFFISIDRYGASILHPDARKLKENVRSSSSHSTSDYLPFPTNTPSLRVSVNLDPLAPESSADPLEPQLPMSTLRGIEDT
ncbi:hypothetical protein E4U09_002345 [Claviceps aff. purpurea]|uniref:Uncharacterized protein n=1 Tax=Claviceps aff. purpurea TaxID=1967640 RepID=A0A9P7QI04_9HYPO|nr:hypothetical protein E4U09_002345 [Claviceps aff. purpurea]